MFCVSFFFNNQQTNIPSKTSLTSLHSPDAGAVEVVEAFIALTGARPLLALGVLHALPLAPTVPLHQDPLHARAVPDVVVRLTLAQTARAARALRVRHALSERLARATSRDLRVTLALVGEEAELALTGGFGQSAVGVVHALPSG